MQEINWSAVSAIMSLLTALAAIVAPVITSILTVKSQERIKKMEFRSPRIYDALAEMSSKYSQLPRRSTAFDDESRQAEYLDAMQKHQEFAGACYKVMSLIPGENIHQQITTLLDSFEGSFSPHSQQDKMFCALLSDIHEYLRRSKAKAKA